MSRGLLHARAYTTPAPRGADRAAVRSWMRAHARGHVDPETGELNLTGLAEEAAAHFNALSVLDDDTHWIWDLPSEVGTALGLRLPGDA